VVLVTGDAYVDHPSFGSAVIGRVLEGAGFRVAIIPQPDWNRPESVTMFGRPRLFFGVTAGKLTVLAALGKLFKIVSDRSKLQKKMFDILSLQNVASLLGVQTDSS